MIEDNKIKNQSRYKLIDFRSKEMLRHLKKLASTLCISSCLVLKVYHNFLVCTKKSLSNLIKYRCNPYIFDRKLKYGSKLSRKCTILSTYLIY